jgi:predicted dinucleotide-binding enzyme
MNIGIIGAGPIGSTLATKFCEAGHTVKIANSRGPETLTSIALQTGARAVSAYDAVRDVEVVVISIPMKGISHLPKGLFDGVRDDIVIIDTANYYPERDGRIVAIDQGEVESDFVSATVGRPVIKAFNNMLSQVLATEGRPAGALGRIGMPIAGDNERAKRIASELVDTVGFDGVDAGNIATSWRQQPGTPVYCTDYDAEGVRKAIARADKTRAPLNRDLVWAQFAQIPPSTTPEAVSALVRSISRAANDST